jgi:hypothetical protein
MRERPQKYRQSSTFKEKKLNQSYMNSSSTKEKVDRNTSKFIHEVCVTLIPNPDQGITGKESYRISLINIMKIIK